MSEKLEKLAKEQTVRVNTNPGQVQMFRVMVTEVEKAIQLCLDKDHSYNSSWKREGGIGAFFTLLRPMHRLEELAKTLHDKYRTSYHQDNRVQFDKFDIFAIWEYEDNQGILYHDGTLSACVRDTFVYMMLVMTEMAMRKSISNYSSGTVEVPKETVESTQLPHGAHWEPQQLEFGEVMYGFKDVRVAETLRDFAYKMMGVKPPAEGEAEDPRATYYRETNGYIKLLTLEKEQLQARINGLEEQVQNANVVIAKQREQLANAPTDPSRLENLRERSL